MVHGVGVYGLGFGVHACHVSMRALPPHRAKVRSVLHSYGARQNALAATAVPCVLRAHALAATAGHRCKYSAIIRDCGDSTPHPLEYSTATAVIAIRDCGDSTPHPFEYDTPI